MSDLIDLFRTKAEDLLAGINRAGGLKATVEALRKQMEISDRRRAVSRAKADIKRTHEQITDLVTAVGLQAVALHEAGRLQVVELDPLCSQIVELRNVVRDLENDLARLEAEADAAAARHAGEHCPACGKTVQPGLRFCPHCGTTLAPTLAACPHCHSPIRAEAKFCSRCGRPVDHSGSA
ncbi:MAG: zinc ribbon domain-containing protein [Anaerolineae bacterium]|jgi:membrane protease subunit (stomatin/prohibitin family)